MDKVAELSQDKELEKKIKAIPSLKKKVFVAEYLKNGQKPTQAAMKACGLTNKASASTTGGRMIRDPEIKEVIELVEAKVNNYLKNEAYGAAQRIVILSKNCENEATQLKANTDILDRAGFKPKDKIQIEPVINVSHQIPD